ncbi:MAG: GGDEF domain-containing protein [Gemmatimonadales bacterium]|nr:MAG: GGDEF domain-containing protein [Gemmatimonadales bacterium]
MVGSGGRGGGAWLEPPQVCAKVGILRGKGRSGEGRACSQARGAKRERVLSASPSPPRFVLHCRYWETGPEMRIRIRILAGALYPTHLPSRGLPGRATLPPLAATPQPIPMDRRPLSHHMLRALTVLAVGTGVGFLWVRLLLVEAFFGDLLPTVTPALGALIFLAADLEFNRATERLERAAITYLAVALPGHLLFPAVVFTPSGLGLTTPRWAVPACLAVVAMGAVLHVRWNRGLRGRPRRTPWSPCSIRSPASRVIWLGVAIGSLGPLALLADLGPDLMSPHLLFLIPAAAAGWATGRWGGIIMAWVAVATYAWARRDLAGPMPEGLWLFTDALLLGLGLTVAGWVVAEIRERRMGSGWCRTDPLTGLMDRESFLADTSAELGRARRYGRPVALALLDLNRFRELNETLGPLAGDRILRDVGRVLHRRFRRLDRLARVGPDQFAVLLPETDLAQARIVLVSLRKHIRDRVNVGGENLSLTVGAVAGRPTSNDARALLAQAESAMRRAREQEDGRALHLEAVSGSPSDPGTPSLPKPTSTRSSAVPFPSADPGG